MNCKPNDLAFCIRTLRPENLGLVVRVIKPCSGNDMAPGQTYYEPLITDRPIVKGKYGFMWLVEASTPRLMKDGSKRQITEMPDAWLKPIRGDEGDDETFMWAGKPLRQMEPA